MIELTTCSTIMSDDEDPVMGLWRMENEARAQRRGEVLAGEAVEATVLPFPTPE